jgi:hypothetical protein
MKKIILIYGDDKASKLAIKEVNSLKFKYQNLISKNNIQILMIQDNQLDEQDKFESLLSIRNIGILTEQGKFESLPAIRFINDEELLTVEGYDINNSSNYKDYFLDFLKLRENIIITYDEERKLSVSKINYIEKDMENVINEN